MIVTFKKHIPNYRGVIFGWDKTYNSRHVTNPELMIIDVSEFNSMTQPFYFILGEDGNKHYTAEGTNRLLNVLVYIQYTCTFMMSFICV